MIGTDVLPRVAKKLIPRRLFRTGSDFDWSADAEAVVMAKPGGSAWALREPRIGYLGFLGMCAP